MAILTKKFSEFTSGGDLSNDNIVVGIASGGNKQYNNPWTFLPPGTTAERPTIAASMYFRLRLNTTDKMYEYYNPTSTSWVRLATV